MRRRFDADLRIARSGQGLGWNASPLRRSRQARSCDERRSPDNVASYAGIIFPDSARALPDRCRTAVGHFTFSPTTLVPRRFRRQGNVFQTALLLHSMVHTPAAVTDRTSMTGSLRYLTWAGESTFRLGQAGYPAGTFDIIFMTVIASPQSYVTAFTELKATLSQSLIPNSR